MKCLDSDQLTLNPSLAKRGTFATRTIFAPSLRKRRGRGMSSAGREEHFKTKITAFSFCDTTLLSHYFFIAGSGVLKLQDTVTKWSVTARRGWWLNGDVISRPPTSRRRSQMKKNICPFKTLDSRPPSADLRLSRE